MTQEEKELLIKDLSARLPHKVKASYYGTDEEMECTDIVEGVIIENNEAEIIIGQYGLPIEKIKPYLFPFSSMNLDQQIEYSKTLIVMGKLNEYCSWTTETIDWLLKNHFDFRDLISKGLAIDATGLNIY